MSDARPGFVARLVLAFATFFRLIFDADLAGRVLRLSDTSRRTAAESTPQPAPEVVASVPSPATAENPKPDGPPTPVEGALALLALFQREGRLVDFLEQDVVSFSDAEVGAAARLVHDGCRKALHGHAKVAPVRAEPEESRVTIDEGYDPATVKLVGTVGPRPPYVGLLRHAGWRVQALDLPRAAASHDAEIVAPAEVEV